MNTNELEKKNEQNVAKIEWAEVKPAVDAFENDEGVTVVFEVPGANSGTVDIQVDGKTLTVKAESTLTIGARRVLFKRAFQISDAVDATQATAKTVDGVLTLFLPKSERAKVHKIQVM